MEYVLQYIVNMTKTATKQLFLVFLLHFLITLAL